MKLDTLFQLASNIVVCYNNIQKMNEEIALQKHDIQKWQDTGDVFNNIIDCRIRIENFQKLIDLEEKQIEASLKQIKGIEGTPATPKEFAISADSVFTNTNYHIEKPPSEIGMTTWLLIGGKEYKI